MQFSHILTAAALSAVVTFSTAVVAQDNDIETLQMRTLASERILVTEFAEIEVLVATIDELTDRFVANCFYGYTLVPEKRKVCNDLLAEISLKSIELDYSKSSLQQALELYANNHDELLRALGLWMATEWLLEPSQELTELRDGPVQPTPDPTANLSQNGIIAKITTVNPCVYRSGGRPDRSNHYCVVEYTLTNATDKGIHFTSGFMLRYHDWNGEIVEEGVGYGVVLQPGKTLKLQGYCVVPHAASYGQWSAGGTGQHRGLETKAAIDQFQWNLEAECFR